MGIASGFEDAMSIDWLCTNALMRGAGHLGFDPNFYIYQQEKPTEFNAYFFCRATGPSLELLWL